MAGQRHLESVHVAAGPLGEMQGSMLQLDRFEQVSWPVQAAR